MNLEIFFSLFSGLSPYYFLRQEFFPQVPGTFTQEKCTTAQETGIMEVDTVKELVQHVLIVYCFLKQEPRFLLNHRII